jgi:phosphopantetheinyl transferase
MAAPAICGIDVESVISHARAQRVARQLSSAESVAVHSQYDLATATTSTWVLKEAYAKYLGVGLTRDLRSYHLVLDGNVINCRDDRLPTGIPTPALALLQEGPYLLGVAVRASRRTHFTIAYHRREAFEAPGYRSTIVVDHVGPDPEPA